MTFDEAFYNRVKTDYTALSVYYGSAEGATGNYNVMFKVADLERPHVLCDGPGESGVALYQISTYGGDNAGALMTLAEAIKDKVKLIKGPIGTTTKYRIWDNQTTGVRLIADGGSQALVWGVLFESTIRWEAV